MERIKVLVGYTDSAFREEVRALSPRVELVGAEELPRHPELVEQVEVAFGGLGLGQLAAAVRLRWLQTTGAGVNGLITPETRGRGVRITNTSGMHADSITEHMFGLLLLHARRLAEAWDQQKSRRWKGYDFLAPGRLGTLRGQTLGILGVGAIGAQAASVGRAFGMRVLGLRRSGAPHPEVERMFTPDQRLELLAACDVVMVLLPLTEATHHFVGAAELAVLPRGAVLINAGRGTTVHTEAMLEALRSGQLGAAMLDVTDPEPLPEDHPLWTMENVYITPHYGGHHPHYQQRAGAVFLENLRRYLAGEELLNPVDMDAGY